MNVAIPVWNQMVSPVLDTARILRVYDIPQDSFDTFEELPLPVGIGAKASSIADHADILICGALSADLAHALESYNLMIHPWIMGDVKTVIDWYVHGNITTFEYTMPGCRRMKRQCGRHSCRGRHGMRHINGA